MKKFIPLMLILALISCKNNDEPVATNSVNFKVTSLQVGMSANTPSRKASSDMSLTKSGLTNLWVFEGNKLLCHQVSTDANFGLPAVDLTTGQHTLTFVASSQNNQQFVNGVWSAKSASETYGKVFTVNVQMNMSTQSVILNRANYVLKWESLDNPTSSVDSIEVSITGMRKTLLGGLAGGTVNNSYKVKGKPQSKGVQASSTGFCRIIDTDEIVTTTFTAYSSTGDTLYRHTVDVPILSNRTTIIKGNLFSSEATFVQVNSDFLADEIVEL